MTGQVGTASPSRNGGVTVACAACGEPMAPSARRRFCSEACRQSAWRRRHAAPLQPPALPPQEPRRPVSVYICPECETRYLGEQWCPDCHRFCRGAGVGGHCPCCDEPVAYDELVR
jgi:predicted nucleic acid-binding Zn ribbon protein